jgi:hypothetical protein
MPPLEMKAVAAAEGVIMKQKILALLACAAITAAFSTQSNNHGWQSVAQVKQTLQPRVGFALCSAAWTGNDDELKHGYLVLLNLNGDRIGGQVEFDEHGPTGLSAGIHLNLGCR